MPATVVSSAPTSRITATKRTVSAVSAADRVTSFKNESRTATSAWISSTPSTGKRPSADSTSTPASCRSSSTRLSLPDKRVAWSRRTAVSNSARNGSDPAIPATAASISGLAATRSGSDGSTTRSVISRAMTVRTSGSASAAAARSANSSCDSNS
jgi:hypothetical protein